MTTKSDALLLYQALNRLGNMSGVKFAYGVSRNLALLKPEIESLQKAIEATPEFMKFDEKRVELAKKYAKKDDKGEPIITNNNYEMENQVVFDEEFSALKEEYKKEFEARQAQLEEYNEMLQSESDVVLYKIPVSYVPETINVSQMNSIAAIITDDVPSPYPVNKD
jgi:hypothetical protein